MRHLELDSAQSDGAGGGGRPLVYEQTVSRHLVHRAAVAEVFVTDAVALGGDRFRVGCQWPRDHALYHPDGQGRTDTLLLAETVRQALVYLGHWHYGIPLTHRFVGYELEFEVTSPHALCVGGSPAPVELDAHWVWTDHKPPRRYGARLEARFSVGGRECGRAALRIVAIDERAYRILRNRGAAAAPDAPDTPAAVPGPAGDRRVEPGRLGRLRAKDSVLAAGPTPGEWHLVADPRHAILFDHPTDHLPVMVLLEGFRQLGHLLVHQEPRAAPESAGDASAPGAGILVAAEVDCRAFGEMHLPTRLVVREDAPASGPSGPARRLRLDAVQQETTIAACTTLWAAAVGTAPSRVGPEREPYPYAPCV